MKNWENIYHKQIQKLEKQLQGHNSDLRSLERKVYWKQDEIRDIEDKITKYYLNIVRVRKVYKGGDKNV